MKNIFKLRNAVLVAAIASSLAACGGNGGGTAAAVTPFTGTVVDGKVTGATVFCDADDSGSLNGTESTVTTDGSGNFTITGGCSKPIVAYGGTNADTGKNFLGKLKAPASTTNTSFVTPLTTLMKDGGLTAAEIVTALTLPAGTDPTKVDPSTAGNEEIHAATVAVQQIIQQTASAIVAAGSGTAPTVTSAMTQSLYALVANRVATHIKNTPATPLIAGNSGTATAVASTVLVNLIVRDSITDVAASTDANLTATKTSIVTTNSIDATSVAALTAAAIANQADALATQISQTNLTAQVNLLQPSVTIATVVAQLVPVLSTTASTAASATVTTQLATAATALEVMSTDATTYAAQTTVINTAAAVIDTAVPAITVTAINPVSLAPTNYLAVANDTVSFNGTSYTLASFKSPGVTVNSPVQGSLDTIALIFSPVGTTPFTSTTGAAASTTASLGLEVKDVSTTNQRVLQMVIDKVDLALSGGMITATIPAAAKLYVYGKNTAGTSVNVTLTNVAANSITSANNTVSFNAGTVLDAAIASLGTSNTVFSNIRNAKGTFNVKFALTNTDLYTGTSPIPADAASVQVTNTTVIATGKGAAGKVTVQ